MSWKLKMEALFPEIPAICRAARAVMCHRFRWQIFPLSADPGVQEPDWFGRDRQDVSIWPLQDLERNRQAAMFLSAGDIAAYMHLARQLGRQDLLGRSTLDQAICLSIAAFPNHPVRLEQFLDKLLEDARTELKAHWSHVERLAAALLKHRELSAKEIVQILENARAEHP
ncbi:MAG: hypothetical protein ABSG68_16620 [Thermoguttaceae bacterium]|jgi:hypothetical protein